MKARTALNVLAFLVTAGVFYLLGHGVGGATMSLQCMQLIKGGLLQ